ncbi:tryptophan halogenase family protein [Congregibacter brevis]|uniref:Tryptophan halogenase family protein n=1 Tax=Congregibacter brevis TaxID=3081201 RepID=A0ABZ0IEY5_9GAMM|nr:tryptophan halogenase family protein [Congregibacter sp. IMCC45268]
MAKAIQTVVIVGGGSAGWLTAGLLAAEIRRGGSSARVCLVESPDVSPIGVGEGTWPTMRSSLIRMGISETDFLNACDASFKQGTHFVGWLKGGSESYYHPFTPPRGFSDINLAKHWQAVREQVSFCDAVSPQAKVCEQALGPKQIVTPEYASNLNYGYHLDAGKFAELLQRHCVETLGVEHLLENVDAIENDESGDISGLRTSSGRIVTGDLFVDCTGMRSLLLGEHYEVGFHDMSEVLFNDSALAVQVPRSDGSEPVAAATISTAQEAGWIWDIALPTRRGTGYTYSSKYTSDEQAEHALRAYLAKTSNLDFSKSCTPRKISFRPGYREKFWHRNCVAIGLSAGFVEPLEASALVMIELSAKMLGELMPPDRRVMDIVADRFNVRFSGHWERIIEFLKLHYVLSERNDSGYWRDHREAKSIPSRLRDSLVLWRYHCPWHGDQAQVDELFSTASYQYVLYGMDFHSGDQSSLMESDPLASRRAQTLFKENARETQKMLTGLPANRELIDKINRYGLSRV